MAYTDVISLADAKSYLGVDDTSRDTEITRMIKSALSYIEKKTNIILFDRDKDYLFRDGCVRVYDSPINTLDADLASSVTRTNKGLYSIYEDTNTDNATITLNVGYTDASDIDIDLIEAGYMIIEHLFNNKEGDKTKIPFSAEQIINLNKRFLI